MIKISEECYLKPLTIEDSQSIFNILDAEREYMRVWLPFVDTTKEVDDTRRAIAGLIKANDKHFSIYYNGNLVGLIGFKGTDFDNYITEIGYWLSQGAQGRGIMTKAVTALLELAFCEMEMNRVVIRVAVGNTKSRKIPEKINFRLEGVERDGELLVDNVYTDIAVYSLLKKEYLKNKAKINE